MSVYPYEEGDTIVLGPECFASLDGSVICWRGQNYTLQTDEQEESAETDGRSVA